MEDLRLLPEVGSRDIRIGCSVGGKTVSTHVESRQKAPVLVSLVALLSSLRNQGEVGLFHCRCKNPDCDEAPIVRSNVEGETVTWLVDLGHTTLRYDLDVAQAATEVERVVSLIQLEINGAHGRDFRFFPPENATLFDAPARSQFRGWYLRNNLLYVVSVGVVSGLAVALFRTFF